MVHFSNWQKYTFLKEYYMLVNTRQNKKTFGASPCPIWFLLKCPLHLEVRLAIFQNKNMEGLPFMLSNLHFLQPPFFSKSSCLSKLRNKKVDFAHQWRWAKRECVQDGGLGNLAIFQWGQFQGPKKNTCQQKADPTSSLMAIHDDGSVERNQLCFSKDAKGKKGMQCSHDELSNFSNWKVCSPYGGLFLMCANARNSGALTERWQREREGTMVRP